VRRLHHRPTARACGQRRRLAPHVKRKIRMQPHAADRGHPPAFMRGWGSSVNDKSRPGRRWRTEPPRHDTRTPARRLRRRDRYLKQADDLLTDRRQESANKPVRPRETAANRTSVQRRSAHCAPSASVGLGECPVAINGTTDDERRSLRMVEGISDLLREWRIGGRCFADRCASAGFGRDEPIVHRHRDRTGPPGLASCDVVGARDWRVAHLGNVRVSRSISKASEVGSSREARNGSKREDGRACWPGGNHKGCRFFDARKDVSIALRRLPPTAG